MRKKEVFEFNRRKERVKMQQFRKHLVIKKQSVIIAIRLMNGKEETLSFFAITDCSVKKLK